MSTKIDLKNIEKKAFSSTNSDGITDILWGILLIGFGTNTIFTRLGIDRPLSLIVFAVPVIVLYLLGKKFITTPRLGYVKFRNELLDPHTGSVLAGILAFGISGLAILIYGLARFFRFIKLYPKQNISADYEKPE